MTVNNEQITELIADPLRLEVGDTARLPILGKTAVGVHELVPQADLKVAACGQNPAAIALVGGGWLKGVAPGEAAVEVSWRNNLKEQVAVSVANDPWANLQIKPGKATLNKGQALKYEVTATRGGLLRVVGPDQGLQLAVGDANIAQVLDDLSIGAKREGRTTVVAKYGSLRAAAPLDVIAGNAVATGVLGGGGVIVQPPGVVAIGGGERIFQAAIATTDSQPAGNLATVDAKAAHVVVTPDPLTLWVGEGVGLTVKLDPGGGQPAFPVDFQVTVPDGQTALRVDYDNKLVGLAKGITQVTVTPSDTKVQSLSASVAVQVDNPDPLRIEPADITLQVGQAMPPVIVNGKGPDGISYQAAATLDSPDEKVLGGAPDAPGHFVAKAMGRTLLKARYRVAELYSTGDRPWQAIHGGEDHYQAGRYAVRDHRRGTSVRRRGAAHLSGLHGRRNAPRHLDTERGAGKRAPRDLAHGKIVLRDAGHALPPRDRGPRRRETGAAISAHAPYDCAGGARGKEIVPGAGAGHKNVVQEKVAASQGRAGNLKRRLATG